MKRFELNNSLTASYFRETIDAGNELSRQALSLIDFEQGGYFYTFLSDDVDIQDIYKFNRGHMVTNSYSVIAPYLLNKLLSKPNYHLIFDEVNQNYDELIGFNLFEYCGVHHVNEAYYLLSSENKPNLDLVKKCLSNSDALWHCLGILFFGELSGLQDKSLTLPIIAEVCRNADLILTTAYDGEGYIFWERSK